MANDAAVRGADGGRLAYLILHGTGGEESFDQSQNVAVGHLGRDRLLDDRVRNIVEEPLNVRPEHRQVPLAVEFQDPLDRLVAVASWNEPVGIIVKLRLPGGLSGDKGFDDLQDSLHAGSILHAFRNVLPDDATVEIDQNHGRQGDVRTTRTGPFVKQTVFPDDVAPGVAQDREIELIPHRHPFVFGDRIDGNRQQRTRVFHELQMNFSETSELRETR